MENYYLTRIPVSAAAARGPARRSGALRQISPALMTWEISVDTIPNQIIDNGSTRCTARTTAAARLIRE
jgi:hypothetical protein